MAGCIQKFRRGPLADEHQRLVERYKERQAKGQKLASWDETKLSAIEDVAEGLMTVEQARLVILRENQKRSEWMDKRNGGRRSW